MGCGSHDEKCRKVCHEEDVCEEHEHEHKDDFTCWLFEVADEAWTEVLKEKIKAHILATQKDRMEELAKIVAEGNGARWRNKWEKKQGCFDFKEKICKFFASFKK